MAFLGHIEIQVFQNVQIAIRDDHIDLLQLIRIGLQPDEMSARIRQGWGSDVGWMPDGMPAQIEITKDQPVALVLSRRRSM